MGMGPVTRGDSCLVELRVRAHAVDLGGAGEDHARLVLHALADDPEVLLEVQLEDAQGSVT